EWLADGHRAVGAAQAAPEEDKRGEPEQRWKAHLDNPVEQHRCGERSERGSVENERADESPTGRAEPTRNRHECAEVADRVREDQDAQWRDGRAGGPKARSEHGDVERHVTEGADDHERPTRSEQGDRASDALGDGAGCSDQEPARARPLAAGGGGWWRP